MSKWKVLVVGDVLVAIMKHIWRRAVSVFLSMKPVFWKWNFFRLALDGDFEDDSEDEKPKKLKRKSSRQIRHEQDLKLRGKWKEPADRYNPNDRFKQLPNSDVIFQQYFRRDVKPMGGVYEVLVTHVESAREVYLQFEREQEICGKINAKLLELYEDKDVPSLPRHLVRKENACVVKHEGVWYRCRIKDVYRQLGVKLHAADVGKELPLIGEQDLSELKILLKGDYLERGEQAYHSKIAKLCEVSPSTEENNLVKELLPVGSKIMASFDRKPSHGPWRVHLWFGEGKDAPTFEKVFIDELEKRGILSAYLIRQQQAALQRSPPPKPPASNENQALWNQVKVGRENDGKLKFFWLH